MTSRLLLVEPSTTMRFVLDNYVQSLGYTVVSVGDYHDGVEAMRNQFQSFDDDFEAVILGWPSVAVREADTLTALLEQDDFQTLPVLVMSTDQRAETRAWVADRPNSAMLAWKSYESVQELLTPLIKSGVAHTADRPPHDTGAVSIKFDNSDIGVLLIDDSPSIRESLTNVLTVHGYRIRAVASRKEALALCETQSFDIAIVDFYLQDETGDEVCRSLLNADPAIVCAILTSAYSDPIIKLSLRAGAVDCLFKNEAGELLLARIDALSRVVRQRKALKTEQQRLDRLVETLAGATLLINDAHQLTYVSQHAAEQLGFSDRRELLGQSATSVFDPERLIAAGDGQHNAQWVNAEQLAIDVVYQQTPLSGTGERMLNFTLAPPASAAASSPAVSQQQGLASSIKAPIINGADHSDKSGDHATTPSLLFGQQQKGSHARPGRHLSVPIEEYEDGAQAYLGQLAAYLVNGSANSEQVSVLILGVMLRMGDGVLVPVSSQPEVATLVHDSMLAIYRRENHVAQLSDHHYGFILCHREAPLSYLLTRKIMQLCNDTPLPVHLKGKAELCVNGCLTAISTSREDTAQAVLSRALSGLHAVDVRGVNQALLLELKRMLPVYPAT